MQRGLDPLSTVDKGIHLGGGGVPLGKPRYTGPDAMLMRCWAARSKPEFSNRRSEREIRVTDP